MLYLFTKMSADPGARATFIASAVAMVKAHKFDGLDFDWEFPTERGGVPEDKVNPKLSRLIEHQRNLMLLKMILQPITNI